MSLCNCVWGALFLSSRGPFELSEGYVVALSPNSATPTSSVSSGATGKFVHCYSFLGISPTSGSAVGKCDLNRRRRAVLLVFVARRCFAHVNVDLISPRKRSTQRRLA